jgi:hypothetical protein
MYGAVRSVSLEGTIVDDEVRQRKEKQTKEKKRGIGFLHLWLIVVGWFLSLIYRWNKQASTCRRELIATATAPLSSKQKQKS